MGKTKAFIPTFGRLVAEYRITTRNITFESGEASSNNVYRSRKQLFQRARLNAIYKHYAKLERENRDTNINLKDFTGDSYDGTWQQPIYESGAIKKRSINPILKVELLDYHIEYDDTRFSVKRRYAKPRKKKKGSYKTVVYSIDPDTGKRSKFSESDWTYKRIPREPVLDNTEMLQQKSSRK